MPPDPPRLPRRPPVVLGVLGGIASGKSRVAARLAGTSGRVIDADCLAWEALDDPEVRDRVRAWFGEEVLGSDGIDRRALARRVFDDPGARAALEGWIHPLVRARIKEALARAEQEGTPRIVLDVPLLLENDAQHGLVSRCHLLVFVDAPLEERDRRAVERRGWEPGEVVRREAAQLPLAAKRARAHFVVENAGTPEQLDAAVDRVLAEAGLN